MSAIQAAVAKAEALKAQAATKPQSKKALAAQAAFVIDKARILELVEQSGVFFDATELAALLAKYKGDAALFAEIKSAIGERAIERTARKLKIDMTPVLAHDIAVWDIKKQGAMTDQQTMLRKAARNAWEYVVAKSGVSLRDGSTNHAQRGTEQAKAAQGQTKTSPRTPQSQQPAKQEPHTIAVAPAVTVKSFVATREPDLTALQETYKSVKFMLIRVQAKNATLYKGDEGSKLLALHTKLIEALDAL